MLHFHCPATSTDDYYTNFTTRHLPQCPTCRQYHRRLDDSTSKNRALHIKALSDTTQGTFTLSPFLNIYCNTVKCTSTYLTYAMQYTYCAVYTVNTMTAKWLSVPELLQHKVGLHVNEVNTVWGYCKDTIINHYLEHHHFEPTVYPYDSLLLTLYWLRDYAPERAIAAEFDSNLSDVYRHIQHCMDALISHYVPHYLSVDNIPTQYGRLDNGQHYYGAVDSTPIAIHQPEHNADRRLYYHMKAGTSYALKFQLTVHKNGFVWDVSNVVVGSKADAKLFRDSTIPPHIHEHLQLLADKGYQGVDNLITPMKKPRNRELTEQEKDSNTDISSHRAIVENVIHQLKGWSILGTIYRQNRTDLVQATNIVKTVTALYNMRLARMPVRAT